MGKRLLLVEGKDDEHVVKHICGTRGVGLLDIKPQDNVNRLLESFPVWLKESDLEALGVVIDADTNLSARWDALCNRLAKAGYEEVPTSPYPEGTIIEPPPDTILPRVGIWLMPDNRTEGILEDFLRLLIPAGSPLFAHVENSVANIPPGERRFRDLAKPKALIHTWLAWQKEPGKPMGQAITAEYLDAGMPQVDVLVDWLKRLCCPTP